VFEYSIRDFFEAQTEVGVECVVAGSCWLEALVFEYSIRDFFEAQTDVFEFLAINVLFVLLRLVE
jgi:hypothetical protein